MSLYGALLRALLNAGMRGPVREWTAQCADPRAAQAARLEAILAANAGTRFGAEHGFASIRNASDFRARVPIAGYEDFRPRIDAMMRGETNVLTAEPATMFAVTSGTTGSPKYLPVTAAFTQEQHRPHRLWMQAMVRDNPCAADHRFLTVVSPAVEGLTEGGIPFGSMSGKNYRDQALPIRMRHAVPYDVMAFHRQDARYFCFLACALSRRHVSTVTAVNPSTLHLLAQRMAAWSERLVGCLERQGARGKGGFDDVEGLSPQERAFMERQVRPEAGRAAFLRALLRVDGALRPASAWPCPKVLCTWHGGSAPFYLSRLAETWGEWPTRCLGLRASEGVFSIPLANGTPEGALAVGAHFMEFIPEGEEAASHGKTLLAHELETGKRYRLVATTSGGLYRYDLGDVVEVCGALAGGVPLVAFLHRAGNVISITGEKVTEAQAVAAARVAAGAVPVEGFTVTVRLADPPRYVVAVEPQAGDDVDVARCRAFAVAFDRALIEMNCEYASKRAGMRLGEPETELLPHGAYAAWRRRKVESGTPDGQIKPPHFAKDIAFLDTLRP